MTDNIGGINVEIGVSDDSALKYAAELEERLNALESQPYNVTVKFVEEGKPASGRGQKKTTLDASLKLEANAEKNLVAKLKKIEVPVSLKIAEGALDALKKQIMEAFSNFSVIVKIGYEMGEPGQEVPGTHGTVRQSATPDRIAAAPGKRPAKDIIQNWYQSFLAPETQKEFDRLESDLRTREKTASGRQVKIIAGRLRKIDQLRAWQAAGMERQNPAAIARVFGTPEIRDAADELLAEQNEPPIAAHPARPARQRIPPKRGRTIASLTAARRRAETTATPLTEVPVIANQIVAPATAPQNLDPYSYDPRYRLSAPLGDPRLGPGRLEYMEMLEADRERLLGHETRAVRAVGGPNKFGPRFSERPRFDRTRLLGQRGRRRGPSTLGLGLQNRGFFDAFPANPVQGLHGEPQFDPRGRYPADIRLAEIAHKYETGEYGTGEAPLVRDLESRETRPITEEEREYLVAQGLTKNKRRVGAVRGFNRNEREYQIMKPRDLAKEALATLLNSLSAQEQPSEEGIQKLGTLISGRAGTQIGAPGGITSIRPTAPGGLPGFIGVSSGPGGAARSLRDFPAGNRLNQQRVEGFRAQEIWTQLNAEQKAQVLALPPGQQLSYILNYLSPEAQQVQKERRERRVAPVLKGRENTGEELRYPQLQKILEQYQARDTDISGIPEEFLPSSFQRKARAVGHSTTEKGTTELGEITETRPPLSPASVAYARMRQATAEFRKTNEIGRRGRLEPAFEEDLGAIRSYIRTPRGSEKYRQGPRTGVEDRIIEAAKTVQATERASLTAPNRTPLGPARSELAAVQEELYRILGPAATGRAGVADIKQNDRGSFDIVGQNLVDVSKDPRAIRQGRASKVTKIRGGTLEAAVKAGNAEEAGRLSARRDYLLRRRDELLPQAAIEERGSLGPEIIRPNKVFSGEDFAAKVRERAGIAPNEPITAKNEPLMIAAAKALRSEAHGEHLAMAAGEYVSGTYPPPPGGTTPPTGGIKPTAGGGPVDVNIVRSIPLEIKGLAATRGPATGIASEKLPPMTEKERERYKTLTEERSARERTLPRAPSLLQFGGKSDAQIEAEAEILEARTLNPTRAFTTALGAAAAKSFGGGAAFERRVRRFQRARAIQGKAEQAVLEAQRGEGGITPTYLQLRGLREERNEFTAEGKPVPKRLQTQIQAATERLGAAQVAKQEAQERATTAAEKAGAAKASLVSPIGVVRAFGALGIGAAAGREIFSGFQTVIDTGTKLLEEGLKTAADALTGFAMTTVRINSEIAQAAHAQGGYAVGGLAAVAAPSGITGTALEQLTPALTARAIAENASTNAAQLTDLYKAATNDRNAQSFGFDKALFQGYGGVFDTGFLGNRSLVDILTSQAPLVPNTANMQGLSGGRAQAPVRTGFASSGQATPQYLAELNRQLGKANSNFKILTDLTDPNKANSLAAAMQAAADSIGQGYAAKQLINQGIVLTGPGGQGLSGDQFGQALQDLATGLNKVDLQSAATQMNQQLQAQLGSINRQTQRQIGFNLPVQAAVSNLQSPLINPASLFNANDQANYNKQLKTTQDIQAGLNDYYKQGQQLIKSVLPTDILPTFNEVVADSKSIATLTEQINKEQANLSAADYANQLRIADRSLGDIAGMLRTIGLQSKDITKTESSQLGVLQGQQVLLQRRSQLLAFEQQQRSLNLQVALASFQAPGETSEERAARREDALAQAKIAQQQLDIQKQLFTTGVKIFDIEQLRQATDLVKQIGLLTQGRKVQLDTTAAQAQIGALQQRVTKDINQINAYISAEEAKWSAAESELTTLEGQYGKFIARINLSTSQGIIDYLQAVATGMGAASSQLPTNNYRNQHAAGALFTTAGPTSMIVGEAGSETVAVLRNPRTVTPMATSSGGVTININNPTVRDDTDIKTIVRQVEDALNRRTQLMGLR